MYNYWTKWVSLFLKTVNYFHNSFKSFKQPLDWFTMSALVLLSPNALNCFHETHRIITTTIRQTSDTTHPDAYIIRSRGGKKNECKRNRNLKVGASRKGIWRKNCPPALSFDNSEAWSKWASLEEEKAQRSRPREIWGNRKKPRSRTRTLAWKRETNKNTSCLGSRMFIVRFHAPWVRRARKCFLRKDSESS